MSRYRREHVREAAYLAKQNDRLANKLAPIKQTVVLQIEPNPVGAHRGYEASDGGVSNKPLSLAW